MSAPRKASRNCVDQIDQPQLDRSDPNRRFWGRLVQQTFERSQHGPARIGHQLFGIQTEPQHTLLFGDDRRKALDRVARVIDEANHRVVTPIAERDHRPRGAEVDPSRSWTYLRRPSCHSDPGSA